MRNHQNIQKIEKKTIFFGILKRRKFLIVVSIFFLVIAVVAAIFLFKRRKMEQANYYHQEGVENFSKGNFDEAIDFLEKNDKKDRSAETFFKIAVSYYNKRDYEDAINNYKEVIAQDPSNYLAYNGIANAYRDQKDNDNAIKNYNKAIELNPAFALAYSNLAILLMDSGEKEQARQVIEDGLTNTPNSQELKNIATFLDGE